MDQPDPAPPPRGLKPAGRDCSMAFCMCWEPDPAPPPRGLKLGDMIREALKVVDASPTPPHLRGDCNDITFRMPPKMLTKC